MSSPKFYTLSKRYLNPEDSSCSTILYCYISTFRCLDCTVCEGCGQRNDESRLILCDDCDVSYHTYCMDPPLDYVPHGNWKCKVSYDIFYVSWNLQLHDY